MALLARLPLSWQTRDMEEEPEARSIAQRGGLQEAKVGRRDL